jgi:hypothetical protein
LPAHAYGEHRPRFPASRDIELCLRDPARIASNISKLPTPIGQIIFAA